MVSEKLAGHSLLKTIYHIIHFSVTEVWIAHFTFQDASLTFIVYQCAVFAFGVPYTALFYYQPHVRQTKMSNNLLRCKSSCESNGV